MLRSRHRLTLMGIAGLMTGSGTLHLVAPGFYRRIVPRVLGHADAVVAVSGVCELACAALLLLPATRRLGAYATAALLVAVFPANVQMAVDGGLGGASFPVNSAVAAWLRLPLQVPLVLWTLRLRDDGAG
ncbi:MAG: hypothetical protein JWM18_2434 [Chloroflexi bacterium]|jgi:uncharacterized membrane protein|nr:hypothetical protein [Chloroflexota bacterium]